MELDGIKMASGQPGAQGPYPGWQQPAYQPPHRKVSDYVQVIVGDLFLAIAVALGLFLLWLGSLIYGVADTDTGFDVGSAFHSFGMLLLTLALFLGAVLRHDMDNRVRVSLVTAGTLLIIFVGYWTGLWTGFMSIWG